MCSVEGWGGEVQLGVWSWEVCKYGLEHLNRRI